MQTVGPYQIVRQIAAGGMAEVYLAKTTGVAGFERYVALKMIHPNLADDPMFVSMLVDEAKIAVQLTHPNIAQTLDLGCVGDRYYLAMEYVEGLDVFNLIRAASSVGLALPFDACAFIARELVAGLDHAHSKRDERGQLLGILHRDVASDNVLISYSGAVKLVDFGIAKAASKSTHTAIGVIKGKYAYMSPEQACGASLDVTSDIYSAGVVLYEMLTGRTLYDEPSLQQLAVRIRDGVFTPPSRFRADIPPQLERIVMRALARDRQDRYQSAGELALELQHFLQAYSPVFVTATLGSYVSVLLDRVRLGVVAQPANPPAMPSPPPRCSSPNVIARKQREPEIDPFADLEIEFTIEDPSKQIQIWSPHDAGR